MLRKIYIELTETCNLECEICFRHNWGNPPIEMALPVLNNLISQINNLPSLETVVIGGIGEPLNASRFNYALNSLKHKKIHVTTNGVLLHLHLNEELIRNVHLLIVSIDGMEQQMLKSRGIVLDELIVNIDRLNSLKKQFGSQIPYLDIQFVASRKNINDIFPLMDLLAEKHVRNIIVSHLMPQDSTQADDILYSRFENKVAKELFNRIRNHSFKRGLRIVLPEIELKTERRCAFVNNDAAYITAKGEVVPCYRLSHEGKEVVFGREKSLRQYSFGNVADNTIEFIWNSDGYRKFRKKIFNNHFPSCPDCDLVEGCSLINDVEFDC
ncbi:MAG: SPASM domain-containing protein, partial [Bacteroidales bacterium]|nr:SPASM domain-containing protein [Bacteroidales bacterium]